MNISTIPAIIYSQANLFILALAIYQESIMLGAAIIISLISMLHYQYTIRFTGMTPLFSPIKKRNCVSPIKNYPDPIKEFLNLPVFPIIKGTECTLKLVNANGREAKLLYIPIDGSAGFHHLQEGIEDANDFLEAIYEIKSKNLGV